VATPDRTHDTRGNPTEEPQDAFERANKLRDKLTIDIGTSKQLTLGPIERDVLWGTAVRWTDEYLAAVGQFAASDQAQERYRSLCSETNC